MATTFTLGSCADVWPVGTTVSAYPRNAIRPGTPGPPAGAAALTTAVVAAGGSLAFSGLPDRSHLVAHAAGVDRAVGISTFT